MAGGHQLAPQFFGSFHQEAEFDRRVAQNTRDRGDSLEVALHEGGDDFLFQSGPDIHHFQLDPQFPGSLPCILGPLAPGLQINAHHFVPLLQQQAGTQSGIHAARKPQNHFFQTFPSFSPQNLGPLYPTLSPGARENA